MADTIYYSDKDLTVTGSTITIRGKSYPVSEVQSVRTWRTRTGSRRELPYLLITSLVVLVFLVLNLSHLQPDAWANVIPIFLTLDLLFGVGACGLLLTQLFLREEDICLLALRGNFGASLPLRCADEQQAQRMVDAVRMAILNREVVESATSAA